MKVEEIPIRKKGRTEDEKSYLTKRLKVIEGQVRGVRGMIEENRYCADVLVQIAAVTNSLKSLGAEVLKSHLSTCVVQNIKENNLEVIDEVMDLIGKLK